MDKNVLITGVSMGIGLALSKLFLENANKVIGTCRSGEIDKISHPNLEVIKLDLSDFENIENAVETLVKKYKIDVLINNAAIGPDLDTNLPEKKSFKQTFDVNVSGTVFFTESLIDIIKADGKIINISSEMGSIEQCRRSDSVAYRMSKSALNMYTKILSNRMEGRLKVASVHPGWVRTTIAESNISMGRLSPEESATKIYNFVTGEFKTGLFWDIESQAEMAW